MSRGRAVLAEPGGQIDGTPSHRVAAENPEKDARKQGAMDIDHQMGTLHAQSAPVARRRLSRAEFADLFETSARALWCIAAGVLGHPQHADDCVQDAVLVALEKLDQFDPATNFAAWMARIVRFTALNAARRGARRTVVSRDPTILDEAAEAQPRIEAVLDAGGALRADQGSFDDRVLECLDALEPTARACLLLRTVLDMRYREMARVLDIPEGTAMSHVHRAKRELRRMLEDKERTGDAGGRRS
jgi:RNA polymerase sigma-70 factor (ECF subfamily)